MHVGSRPGVVTSLLLLMLLLAAGCPSQTAGGKNERRDPARGPGRVAPRWAPAGGEARGAAGARGTASAAGATSGKRPTPAPLGARDLALMDRFFARYAGEGPGASVILIKDGTVLAERSYGYADLQGRLKASAATNYRSASVTKQFTAMAVMLLVKDKKLSYGSTLTDVFPDFPAYGKAITIQHLLVHRSGLVDYMTLLGKGRRDQILDPEVLARMKAQRRTLFAPGTRYQYSNSGYAVLAEVVAKVSGLSFAEFLKRRIFAPLGMKNTVVGARGTVVTHRARGYVRSGAGWVQKDQCVTCAVQGDGGVYTSVADYAKWDRALWAGTLLPRPAWEAALRPWHDSPSLLAQKYGHGWRIDWVEGTRIVHHSGHTQGFTNYTLRIPRLGFTFAAFTNRGGEDAILRIGNTLAALYAGGDLPVPMEPWVEAAFDAGGTSAALEAYGQLKTRKDRRYLVDENALLVVGRKLQKRGRIKDAMRVYRFNLQEYPHSFLTWFELANCQHRLGATGAATAAYRKAVRLIPARYRRVFETASTRTEAGAPP